MPSSSAPAALRYSCVMTLAAASLLYCSLAFPVVTPQLAPISAKSIIPEQPFSHTIVVENTVADVRFRMLNGPAGSALSTDSQGKAVFTWQPPADMPNETVVIIQSFVKDNPVATSTQRLVLRRSTTDVSSLAESSIDASSLKKLTTTPEHLVRSDAPRSNGSSRSVPNLPEIGYQQLFEGQSYALIMRPVSGTGTAVRIDAPVLPAGARFDPVLDGTGAMLSWTPRSNQIGDHRIEFIVRDHRNPDVSSVRNIFFRVSSAAMAANYSIQPNEFISEIAVVEKANSAVFEAQTTNSADADVTVLAAMKDTNSADARSVMHQNKTNSEALSELNSATAITEASLTEAAEEPYIEPIPIPLVSAGYIVKFKVIPRMPDDSTAVLHVDRLPGEASFDENKDGTRTFYWPTTLSDQGEHIFRFTAIHPRDADKRVSRDALIVVGDPSAEGSRPQGMSIDQLTN